MKNILTLLFVCFFAFFFSQSNILDRLVALNNNGKTWYNIDGYSVTSEEFDHPFDEKSLKKIFKKHKISDTDIKIKDEKIGFKNYFRFKIT